jgi:plastocyanin
MKRFAQWLGVGLVAGSLLVAIGGDGWAGESDEADIFEIIIKDLDFKYQDFSLSGRVVVLPAGITVSWMNVDPLITTSGLQGTMPHGVKITDQEGKILEQSPLLFQGVTTFEHSFDKPGVYPYQCIVHPFMKGKFQVFEVEEASTIEENHAAQHANKADGR